MSDSFHKIFVAQVTGISQTVLALPALRALRHAFPQAHITVAASRTAQDVVQLSHCADEVLALNRKRLANPMNAYRSLKSLNKLRHDHFDLMLELQHNTAGKLARLMAQRGAPQQSRRLLDRLREAIINHSSAPRHDAQRYLDALAAYGAYAIDSEPKLYTDYTADERFEARLRKSNLLAGGLLIGLHPGAGRNQPRWPVENFVTVAAKMIHLLDARVLVFAGPQERGLARYIVKQLPAKKALAYESVSLLDVASALARLSVFIGHQSGPAHLAAALGVPVIALAPASRSHSADLLSASHRLLQKDPLIAITPDEVYEAAGQLLQANRAAHLWAR